MTCPVRLRPARAVCCTLAALLAVPATAYGQGLGAGSIDGIVNAFNAVRGFEATLVSEASRLFLGLALIEFVLVVGRQVIARADVVGILATVLFQVVTLGFFYWVLIHGADISRAIVSSFAQIGSDASQAAGGGRNVSPGDIFNVGLGLVKAVWDAMSIYDPVKSTLLAFAGLIVLYVFAMCAAMLIEVIVESYFVASVGVILLGFGGASYTRHLAVAQLHLAIAVGMKRLVLQVLVGVAEIITRGWAANVGADPKWLDIAVMVGVPLVLLRLVTTLPQRAQDMVLGTSSNMGAGLGAAPRMAAALAAGLAAGAVGGGAAVAGAFKQASAQIAAREEGGQGGAMSNGGGASGAMGAIGRAAQITGMAAQNIGRAAASDVGQRMTGNYAAQHGHSGFRMADAMNARAGALRAATGSNSGNAAPMPAGSTASPGNQVGPAPTASNS